jgi:putative thioredoxin
VTSSDFIIDVSENDFENEVLVYSEKTPVVVDFWAEWCIPCRTLGPLLERLAQEGRGSFRLAKINVDRNPNLAKRFQIRSIPAVKAFRNFQVVAEFSGVQTEERLRELVRSLVTSESDLQLEKGQSLLYLQKWADAETTFQEYLESNPRQPTALLGLLKSLLLQGKIADAQPLLARFPDSKELTGVENLRPLFYALERVKTRLPLPEDDLEAAYQNALRLAGRGNLFAAIDGVMDVLRQNKRFRDNEARKVMIGLLEILDPADAQTRQYRSELALILF